MFSILNPTSTSLPYHPGSSQCTSPEHPVSCIEPGLAVCFTDDIIHVSLTFSQIIPPSPSPTESIRLFYTSVSLLLSHIQGYCYHLSKFHIYIYVSIVYWCFSFWITSLCIIGSSFHPKCWRRWMLLAFGSWRHGMLLNNLQCTGQPP